MKEFWTYTGMRIGLFVACTLVTAGIWALVTSHVDWLFVLLIGVVASSVLSWWVLSAQRERLAAGVEARAHRMSQRFEEMKSKEDED